MAHKNQGPATFFSRADRRDDLFLFFIHDREHRIIARSRRGGLPPGAPDSTLRGRSNHRMKEEKKGSFFSLLRETQIAVNDVFFFLFRGTIVIFERICHEIEYYLQA